MGDPQDDWLETPVSIRILPDRVASPMPSPVIRVVLAADEMEQRTDSDLAANIE